MSAQLIQTYSTALYEAGKEADKTTSFEASLEAIKPVFEDEQIMQFFNSPVCSSEEKEAVVVKAFADKVDGKFLDFLKLLAKNDRLSLLPEIVDNYQECCCSGENVRKGTVTSASVLSPDEQSTITKCIEEKLGFPVALEYSVDAKLGAGIEARVGSYLIEDSLKSGLQRLKDTLKRSAH